MTDERQIVVPASFLALYTPTGKTRPTPPREWLEQRHDLCEDFSQLLYETVTEKILALGITESDAVERVQRGMAELALDLSEAETEWVMTRLDEILRLQRRY